MRNLLIDGAKQLNLTINTQAINQLLSYLDLLYQWNKVYNLCAKTSYKQMICYHLLDSMSASPYVGSDDNKLLDVGTGAGLPGIPLAIINPNCKVTLLESKMKKVVFLKHAVNVLQLKNVHIVLSRIENYQIEPKQIKNHLFEIIISRAAIADLVNFVHLTARLCATKGIFIAMKSDPSFYKINSIIYNQHKIIELKTFKIPGVQSPRTLVIMQ